MRQITARKNKTLNLKMRDYYVHQTIPVIFIKIIENEEVDVSEVIRTINKKVPKHLFYGVDEIYVGHFPEFDERKINAMYKDGAIYVTNEQENTSDMIDDIIHELAHATEENYNGFIYEDGDIEKEFLGKRKRLYKILKSHGLKIKSKSFLNPEYDINFDFFLLKKIGYSTLKGYIKGLFTSCYSVTSLNEYYAVNFTDYFLYNRRNIKSMCPAAYNKIENLNYYNEENKNEYQY